jgi:putative peptidoglycan lipid II flippase
MLKKLFSGKIDSITIAAALVASSSLISRLLGIFRDRILAGEFGAGDTLDVYYAAFRIPDLIFNLLVLGALSAGFVPIFTGLLKNHFEKVKDFIAHKENEEAWNLASNILNLIGVFLIVFCFLGIVLAPFYMKYTVPGFNNDKLNLTIALTRIMFLSPFFLGLSSVIGGVLQSFKRFFVYSLSPIMYNIGIIIGALYFVPYWGIYGLAWGVVVGAAMHLLIQMPMVFKLGFKYKFKFEYWNEYVKKIGKMMVPRTLSLGISQINLLVITIIASTLVSGSLSIFNLANNLQSFPIGIFGLSFAIAAFPTLSAVAFNKKQLVNNFSNTFRQILFFIVPSTVLLITLRAQIIRVVLGTGKFDWEDTVLTINTLGFFAISLFAQATIPLLTRVYYARQNSTTPFYVGLGSALLNVFLSLWLVRIYGVAGLALAFSIASIFNFVLLWVVLRFEIGNMDEIKILKAVTKFSAASLACGVTIQGLKLVVWPFINMSKFWGVLFQGAIAGAGGILVYLAFCSLLRSEELFNFWSSIKRRLPGKKINTGDQGEARGI